jgi:hypothetical protein
MKNWQNIKVWDGQSKGNQWNFGNIIENSTTSFG